MLVALRNVENEMSDALYVTNIASLPLLARGKVRDNYVVDSDKLLMVATDRLSAFDVVLSQPIPGKGNCLTEMSLFWFEKLRPIVRNHLTGSDPLTAVTASEQPQVRGRSMLVRKLRPIPVEAVVRGYMAGSAWSEYQRSRSVCGVELPAGLRNASKLPAPTFTPAKKALQGLHDENMSFDELGELIGQKLAEDVRDISVELYKTASEFAAARGIIIADTKFEFGLDDDGALTLMDEVLTPDSSRFWSAADHAEGANPRSFDKQFVRDWLENLQIDGKRWNKLPPAPDLPEAVISQTSVLYREALLRLTA